jgi:segregation and condensation protein B
MKLIKIIEAVLFSSSKPITLKLLKKRLEEYPSEEIEQALRELTTEYSNLDRAVEIAEVAGGFQMKTKPIYKEWVKRFVKEKDVGLTKSMLETLSIIAYKQPITKKDIDSVRGVDSTRAIKLLLERKLIGIAGKNGDAGKKIIFRTTEKFLEVYGLRSIDDLPTYKDIESLELEPKIQGMDNSIGHSAEIIEHDTENIGDGAKGEEHSAESEEHGMGNVEHSAENMGQNPVEVNSADDKNIVELESGE